MSHHPLDLIPDITILPLGWRREEVVRPAGLSTGKIDVIYVSPSGERLKSKLQLQRALGDIDLTAFDFETGKINPALLRRHRRHRGSMEFGRSVRNDLSLIPPIRQTASIFKQPVTVVKSTSSNKSQPRTIQPSSKQSGLLDKPRQMFWEKRLQGLRPSTVYEEDFDYLRLPRTIRPIPGPAGVSEDVAIRSLASALQLNPTGIIGQTYSKSDIEKNAGVFVNPDQPLVTMALLSDEDIARQEARVKVARRHLEEELASLAAA